MRRLNQGAPLRAAVKEAGLNIPRLVEATQRVDPDGAGLSRSLIGFIVGKGKSAREDCSDRAAELLAQSVGRPLGDLFDTGPPSSVVAESTSTPRVQTLMSDPTAPPPPLMKSSELCAFLRKSPSWLEKQISSDPEFPVHYVGRTRRYFLQEVLDHQARRRAEHVAARSAA